MVISPAWTSSTRITTPARGRRTRRFRRLRAEAPVSWHEMPDGTASGRSPSTSDVCRDIARSEDVLVRARRRDDPAHLEEKASPQPQKVMLNMDPPQHTKYRRLVNLGFSPDDPRGSRSTSAHDARAASSTRSRSAGECDFVTDVAAELPLQVIVEMLGVPHDGPAPVFEWSNSLIGVRRSRVSSRRPSTAKIAAVRDVHVRQRARRRAQAPARATTSSRC